MAPVTQTAPTPVRITTPKTSGGAVSNPPKVTGAMRSPATRITSAAARNAAPGPRPVLGRTRRTQPSGEATTRRSASALTSAPSRGTATAIPREPRPDEGGRMLPLAQHEQHGEHGGDRRARKAREPRLQRGDPPHLGRGGPRQAQPGQPPVAVHGADPGALPEEAEHRDEQEQQREDHAGALAGMVQQTVAEGHVELPPQRGDRDRRQHEAGGEPRSHGRERHPPPLPPVGTTGQQQREPEIGPHGDTSTDVPTAERFPNGLRNRPRPRPAARPPGPRTPPPARHA